MTAHNETTSIRELIDRMARTQPEDTFLISPDTGKTITFRGLQEQSIFLANELRSAGLAPGDKIAFLLDNGLFTAQLFLGVMYGGFVVVPLNVGAGVTQLSFTLDNCDANLVYAGKNYSGLIEEVIANVPRAVRVISVDADDLPPATSDLALSGELPPPQPEAPALLMYTSGSTGQPKAATHSHRTVLAGARNSVCSHQLSAADRSLLLLPLYHINAECVTLVPTLLSGGSVVVPHRFSVSQFWDWLDDFGCTWSAVVPTIISQLLDWRDPRANSRAACFARLRFLRSSSAPLAPSLHREFLEKFPVLLIQAMGSSECGNIFSNPLPPGANKIGSPGLPWGFEARIVDRECADVPAGESGEVLLRGPAIMQGYYKQPEETAAVLDADGWLHTGDLAYRDEDGYFFVVGRSKELIIKGGVNIAPRQIDDVLESHPAVLEAAAVGVPDHYLGEDLVAFVVLRADAACDESELLTFCEGRLGHFKTPTRIYFATDLPKGPSGKVQRLRLREDATQPALTSSPTTRRNGNTAPQQSPLSSIEQTISEAWAEVLSVPQIDASANFFALGGHSLLAVQCVSRLREKIPVALSLSDFFENGTVVQQAALIRRRLDSGEAAEGHSSAGFVAGTLEAGLQDVSSSVSPAAIPPRDRTRPCPLSPAQRRLWFLEQLNPGLPVYNEAEAFRLHGDLNVEALERALNVVVERHEVLRTTIQSIDGEPFALVHQSWPIQVKQIDLSALAESERASETERLLVEEPAQLYHLETTPGIRVTLLRLGAREHVLILMMHHIICDWSSEGVFWRELAPLYRSFLRGELPALATPAVQHGDYAAWQARMHDDTTFAEALSFWEENLRGAPHLLELPADRTRPATPTYRGERQRIFLNSALTKALRNLSQQVEKTLFTVFAAALDTLLYRCSGQEDILLGIPIADRDRKDLQGLIGFLLHTQVLRTTLSPAMTFRELLSRVQSGVLSLYLHRAVPFDQVVRKLRPERNLSYSPLFQVMLIARDRDQLLSFVGLEGLEIKSAFAHSGAAKFDLTLFITDCGDEIWLELEYSTDLFDDARMVRMLSHYQALLESVATNPDQQLAKLPILTPAEQRQMLLEWNQTETAYPRGQMLHALIEAQVERSPDACAVVFENRQLSYRQLDNRADQIAQGLQMLGIGPNTLVAICVERSLEMLVGLLGILKAGGAYVPLDPAYPIDRLAFMLEDCQPHVLLTQEHLRSRLPTHHGPTVLLEAETTGTRTFPLRRESQPDDLAYVLYTSGSTGKPKGVRVANSSLVNLLCAMQREPGLASTDTLLAVTTLSFDIAGLELFLPLISGARVVIASRETAMDGAKLAAMIQESAATVMQATPATWRMLLDSGWTGSRDLKILCGGEAWSAALAAELLPRCKSLWNMYGPTETTIWSAVSRVEAGKAILIGYPIANTTFHVLDAARELVPIGVPGELYIGGEGIAEGYLKRPELTEERFIPDPFTVKPGARLYKTGDLVRRLPDGQVEFLRRTDQQVKIRGFRIELEEVEAALRQHPGVCECVAIAQEDPSGDKRLVAYIVPGDPANEPGAAELRSFLNGKLPDYMLPAAFRILNQFPVTRNGKIDRKALALKYAVSESGNGQASIGPQNLMELRLQKMWESILGVVNIGAQDSFFNLGGHSLLALRLIGEMNKVFSAGLTLPIFFLNPTIEGIARVLKAGKYAKLGPHLIPLRKSAAPGALFFLDASMAMCQLAQLLNTGPAIFATEVPLSSRAYRAAVQNDTSGLPLLEDLAAAHVTLIESQPFSGPCLLAGHSFGGLLAFEVANQLRRRGIHVETIFLLDSWLLQPSMWARLRLLSLARVRGAIAWRSQQLRLNAAYTMERITRAMRPKDAGYTPSEEAGRPMVELPFEFKRRLYSNARSKYQLRPLDSSAVLFYAPDNDVSYEHLFATTSRLRGLFTGGLELVETPGDHLSLLQEPNISLLAQKFDERLSVYRASIRADELAGKS